ncbi:MAG TPA: general stress protein [Anaerolineae bacterium]|nr:general stress protein [Anaerolineae bacterium]
MRTVIAELCQNHNGDLTLLKEMVWAAAESGATYAKIQSMLADDLTTRERFEEGRWENGVQVAIKRPYLSEYNRLKPMDLDDDAHYLFAEECVKAGIKPLTTIFSRSRIPFISSLGWDAIKVASYDCASYPMIEELKEQFSHLYISTGATFDHEIEKTSNILKGHSFSLLHCVTIYPTPMNELNLARLDYLKQFTQSVGFSDHSLVSRDGIKASVAAMAYGADVVERHFTILPPDQTRDGPVSINSEQLAELVNFAKMSNEDLLDYVVREIPEFDTMIGKVQRQLSHEEELNRDYYRGRFASKVGDEVIYNWQDRPVF